MVAKKFQQIIIASDKLIIKMTKQKIKRVIPVLCGKQLPKITLFKLPT